MGCLNSIWSFIKKYGLAFLCGGVAWMLIDVSVTKGIDASFVSACMDFALVVFGFVALFEARKIWSSKAKDDGYKIALDILNYKFINAVMVPQTDDWINELDHISKKYKYLDKKDNNLPQSVILECKKDCIAKLTIQKNLLKNSLHERIFPLSQESQFSILRMRNTGVNFSETEQGKLLKMHFNDLLSLSKLCDSYLVSLDTFIGLNKDEDDSVKINENSTRMMAYISNFEQFNLELNVIVLRMRENLNAVTQWSDKTVVDYFVF